MTSYAFKIELSESEHILIENALKTYIKSLEENYEGDMLLYKKHLVSELKRKMIKGITMVSCNNFSGNMDEDSIKWLEIIEGNNITEK